MLIKIHKTKYSFSISAFAKERLKSWINANCFWLHTQGSRFHTLLLWDGYHHMEESKKLWTTSREPQRCAKSEEEPNDRHHCLQTELATEDAFQLGCVWSGVGQ